MWEHFTETAQRSIWIGQRIAREHGHENFEVVHLFLGVLENEEAIASPVSALLSDAIRNHYLKLKASRRTPRRTEAPLASKPHSALRYSALTGAGAILLGRLIHITGHYYSSEITSIALSYLAFVGLSVLLAGTAISSRSPQYASIWARCLIAYVLGLFLVFALSSLA